MSQNQDKRMSIIVPAWAYSGCGRAAPTWTRYD